MAFFGLSGGLLAQIGTVVSAITTVGQIVSGVSSAGRQEKLARQIGDVEVQQAREDTKRQVETRAIEQRRLLGQQRVRAAAGGIASSTGSPLDIQLETLSLGRQELEDILLTGQRQERATRFTEFGRIRTARQQGTSALLGGLGTLGSLATKSVP